MTDLLPATPVTAGKPCRFSACAVAGDGEGTSGVVIASLREVGGMVAVLPVASVTERVGDSTAGALADGGLIDTADAGGAPA